MARIELARFRPSSSLAVVVHLAALALAFFAGWHALALDYRGDDAAITLRYVRNLLDGYGPVYNPGERVEGYSSFLWLITLAGLGRLGEADLAENARIAGAVLSAICVLMVHRLAWRWHGPRPETLLAPLGLAVSTPFASWGGSGLEAPLFALLTLGAALARSSPRPDFVACGVWLGLCALARPEGALLAAVAVVFEAARLIRTRAGESGRARFRPLIELALPVVVLIGAQLAFRRSYYGEWLANTYYAKVDFRWSVVLRGLGYIESYAGLVSALPFVLAICGAVDAWRASGLRYLVAFPAAYLVWIVAVGGDGLAMYRFVAHVLPLLCLLAAGGALDVSGRLKRALKSALAMLRARTRHEQALTSFGAATWGALGALLVLGAGWPSALLLARPDWPWTFDAASGLSFPDARQHEYRWFDQYFSERVARAGRFLDLHAAPDELVAANPAGIGYHLRQPVLDMLGLNDKVIARRGPHAVTGRAGHERGDGAYVLSRKPAYVLLGNVALLPQPLDDRGVEQRLYLRSERELWADPAFHRDYERVVLELSPFPPHRYFTFYRRRDAAFRPDADAHGH